MIESPNHQDREEPHGIESAAAVGSLPPAFGDSYDYRGDFSVGVDLKARVPKFTAPRDIGFNNTCVWEPDKSVQIEPAELRIENARISWDARRDGRLMTIHELSKRPSGSPDPSRWWRDVDLSLVTSILTDAGECLLTRDQQQAGLWYEGTFSIFMEPGNRGPVPKWVEIVSNPVLHIERGAFERDEATLWIRGEGSGAGIDLSSVLFVRNFEGKELW